MDPSPHPLTLSTAGRAAARALAVLLLAVPLLATGCALIPRLDSPPPETAERIAVLGVPNARFWPDRDPQPLVREAVLMAERQRAATPAGRLGGADFLALSGGSDNGAFGAGLVAGWTETGQRPEFQVVTGISAGALIAPFAFLGPDYDAGLREVFTGVTLADIVSVGGLVRSVLFNEALADTSPLYNLIRRHANEDMLAAIAREYARGRLLLIGTVNLDLQRQVVWNIGAIAASGHPEALGLFRRILLASASIPGAFPPVLVDVEANGTRYQEMHVDGGAATQVFLYPPSIELERLARRSNVQRPQRTVWLVRNDRLDPEWETTSRGILSISRRSLSTLIHFSGMNDIVRIYGTARRDGVGFRLAFIGPDFTHPRGAAFDRNYMQALFDYGRAQARDPAAWRTTPPGIERMNTAIETTRR